MSTELPPSRSAERTASTDEVQRIPILQIEDFLVASIQTALHDRAATQFKDDLLRRIYETKAQGLILDVTGMDVVDSFIAKLTADIAHMAALMGTRVVITGLQPAVAVALVELGAEMRGIITALNLEKGIATLRRLAAASEQGRLSREARDRSRV